MATGEPRPPAQPGEPAPDFTLAAVHRAGTVSLADYRGRSAVLLAMNRGLFCPFCRRNLAQLGGTAAKLAALGVETLAIVATDPERARLYARFHPARVPLAADPDLVSHRAYGLPKPALTAELVQAAQGVRINPRGDLPEAVPVLQSNELVNRLDGFEMTETDRRDLERQFDPGPQLGGQFLVDRRGIVRWTNVECAREGLAGAGKFPADEELLTAARALID